MRLEVRVLAGFGLEEDLPLLAFPELVVVPERREHGAEHLTAGSQSFPHGRSEELQRTVAASRRGRDQFGFLAMFVALDNPASSPLTRELLRWQPEHPGLLDDLTQGHYFQ